ncbi:30S ribosomal protein S13 [Candidatus Pacearchaeota archaeon CG10_big_fil_rev_8_21_14_0_10_32_14]|nr:MAG: 30S ribosomal protein S13 [Candidatus Pacearchaeota archaeon CG10_big_fil_rev_8_21_14_0_10_32_14]
MENALPEKHDRNKAVLQEKLIRIVSTDIPGSKKLYAGLTRIKGVSWSISNATCLILNIDKNKKIENLSQEEIKRINEFLKNPQLKGYLTNRRKDFDDGKDKHLVTNDLDLRNDFDIKRLRKIKSRRGIRHAAKLPLRGQRTKAHFRKNRGKSGGIKKGK